MRRCKRPAARPPPSRGVPQGGVGAAGQVETRCRRSLADVLLWPCCTGTRRRRRPRITSIVRSTISGCTEGGPKLALLLRAVSRPYGVGARAAEDVHHSSQ